MVKKPCDMEPGRVRGLDESSDTMGGGKAGGFHPHPEGQEACSEAEPEGGEGIGRRDGRERIINGVREHSLEEVSRRGYLVAEASPLYFIQNFCHGFDKKSRVPSEPPPFLVVRFRAPVFL